MHPTTLLHLQQAAVRSRGRIPNDSCFHPARDVPAGAAPSLLLSPIPRGSPAQFPAEESPGLGFLPSWAQLHSVLSQTCCSSPAWLPQCSWCPSSSSCVKSAAATRSTQRDLTTDWGCSKAHLEQSCDAGESQSILPEGTQVHLYQQSLPTDSSTCRTSRVAPALNQEQGYFYNWSVLQKAVLAPDKRRVWHLYRKNYCA